MLDGKRDGYGIVYCTSTNNDAWLYECEWKQGSPINNGRFIWIYGVKKWNQWEGPLMSDYLLTGTGSWQDEDRYSYQGQFKQGRFHGQGKYIYPNGDFYQGEWMNNNRTGQGRFTNPNVTSYDGQQKEEKQVGVHKYYEKQGVLTKKQDHK
ncbi:hypothetical protein FGO68_gene1851 [Halteria grandinella]|uniref:MORN repeat protein n=1 Tax=Halteria grandinella TaxID=5974 RepID=A0A8J8NW56_HALGN|nr:hypothetical protein FGO68_gene1851 [Halteria grandinella]